MRNSVSNILHAAGNLLWSSLFGWLGVGILTGMLSHPSPGSCQIRTTDDSTRHILSSLNLSPSFVQVKEGLYRGLVHKGANAEFRYSQRSVDGSHVWDWSVTLAPGLLTWNGSTDISIDVAPIDAGYAIRYASENPDLEVYVGPYARLQSNFTQYIQLDGQHPYWLTLDQLGIRHWLFWKVGEEKRLCFQTDLSLIALASRPPEWRDYQTFTLNLWGIVRRVYESARVVTTLGALRFMTRVSYEVSIDSSLPLVYFYQFEINRADFPANYTNLQSRLGLTIPLHQE